MLRDIISKDVVTVNPNTGVREIAQLMESQNVGAVIVAENGKPLGIVTDRDLVIRCLSNSLDLDQCMATDIMSEALQTANDTDGVYECIRQMKASCIRRLPVVNEDGNVIGLISFDDLILLLGTEISELAACTAPATASNLESAA